MLPRPMHHHLGPVGVLGRLVSDLRLEGWLLEHSGPEPVQVEVVGAGVVALTNRCRFRVVCSGPGPAWTVDEVDQFEWEGARRAVEGVRDAVTKHARADIGRHS